MCGHFHYPIPLPPLPGDVGLVDYEYGGPNYLAFDIADHFTEFAGMPYSSSQPLPPPSSSAGSEIECKNQEGVALKTSGVWIGSSAGVNLKTLMPVLLSQQFWFDKEPSM